MAPIVKNLLLSKKFVVAALTAGASIAAYKGFDVDTAKILTFASPFFVYIGAQGWADAGKEKALIDAASAASLQASAQEHALEVRKLMNAPLLTASVLNAATPPATVSTTTITDKSKEPTT